MYKQNIFLFFQLFIGSRGSLCTSISLCPSVGSLKLDLEFASHLQQKFQGSFQLLRRPPKTMIYYEKITSLNYAATHWDENKFLPVPQLETFSLLPLLFLLSILPNPTDSSPPSLLPLPSRFSSFPNYPFLVLPSISPPSLDRPSSFPPPPPSSHSVYSFSPHPLAHPSPSHP